MKRHCTSLNWNPHFRCEPRTKLSHLKIAISVSWKDLYVYIIRNWPEKYPTIWSCQRRRQLNQNSIGREITFSQSKRPTSWVSLNKFKHPFKFNEKNTRSAHWIAKSKTKHKLPYRVRNTVTTNKTRNGSQKTHLQSVIFSPNNYSIDETDKHPPE